MCFVLINLEHLAFENRLMLLCGPAVKKVIIMSAQPALDSMSEIIIRLSSMVSDGALTEQDIVDAERDAKAGLKSGGNKHQSLCHIVLGVIACLRGQNHKMMRHHDAAIKLCRDYDSLHNFSVSLLRTKHFSAAWQIISEVAARFPDSMNNLSSLSVFINASYAVGREDDFLAALERWEKLTPQKHPLQGRKVFEDEINYDFVRPEVLDVFST